MVLDVGLDGFFISTNGRDEATPRPKLVSRKVPDFSFHILRDPYRILTNNRYYPTFKLFTEAVNGFLNVSPAKSSDLHKDAVIPAEESMN